MGFTPVTSAGTALLKGLNIPLKAIAVLAFSLGLYTIVWPKHADVQDGSCFDIIVIGSGAGSVLANRLTEDGKTSVLLIEAGVPPSVESSLAGLFIILQNSYEDWSFKSEPEMASQSQTDGVFKLAAGRALGGSSVINHLVYLRGDPVDFNSWARITGDDGWNYENVLPYFLKSETMKDDKIMKSKYAVFHNTSGNIILTREPKAAADKYLKSFEEVGHELRLDLNGDVTHGYTQPPLIVGDNLRQSTSYAYIKPISDRKNLHVMYNSVVTKINIDDSKTATSVDVLVNDKTINIKAAKEIIVACGVFNTPKLLMLSGIGPAEHLNSLGIPVVQDLPVGKNLQDHVAVQIIQKMEHSLEISELPTLTTVAFPIIVGNARIDKSVTYPQYQSTNIPLVHDSPYLSLISTQIFGYRKDISEELQKRCVSRNSLYSLVAKLYPKSRGEVLLASRDPAVPPIIRPMYFSNESDLDDMVDYVMDFLKVQNSTYFREVDSEPVTLTFDNCEGDFSSREYVRCYCKNMATPLYHHTSTCPMGSVLDSRLRVIGINNLRVVDASAMPIITRANTLAATVMIAEKASDIIKVDNENKIGLCSTVPSGKTKKFNIFGL